MTHSVGDRAKSYTNITYLNKALLKCLAFKIMSSDSFGFSYLRSHYVTELNIPRLNYVNSSMWAAPRAYYTDLLVKCRWIIREHSRQRFWLDN